MAKNHVFWQYLPNASLDFDEIWPKVALYVMLCFGIGLISGKILNPEIIPLIPYNNGISRNNDFRAFVWIETIPNIISWLQCDEKKSFLVIGLRGIKGLTLKNGQKSCFWHYLPNALFDFDEIWSKVALYVTLWFGIDQIPVKSLNPLNPYKK